MEEKTTGCNMHRAILLLMSKGGDLRFARRGTKLHRDYLSGGYLPCGSTSTTEDAEALRRRLCKRSYDGKSDVYPLLPTVDGLIQAGYDIEAEYAKMREQNRIERYLNRV